MEEEPKEVQEKDCGCVVKIFEKHQAYDPCLSHALDHAGRMLSAAAARIEEQNHASTIGQEEKPKGPKLVITKDMPKEPT